VERTRLSQVGLVGHWSGPKIATEAKNGLRISDTISPSVSKRLRVSVRAAAFGV
jgi:hypothetical protein